MPGVVSDQESQARCSSGRTRRERDRLLDPSAQGVWRGSRARPAPVSGRRPRVPVRALAPASRRRQVRCCPASAGPGPARRRRSPPGATRTSATRRRPPRASTCGSAARAGACVCCRAGPTRRRPLFGRRPSGAVRTLTSRMRRVVCPSFRNFWYGPTLRSHTGKSTCTALGTSPARCPVPCDRVLMATGAQPSGEGSGGVGWTVGSAMCVPETRCWIVYPRHRGPTLHFP